jgi:biotin carboxyl carrier protein
VNGTTRNRWPRAWARGPWPAAPWVALGLLVGFAAAGCRRAPEPPRAARPPRVAVWTVARTTVRDERAWTGTLAPERILSVQAPLAGLVRAVHVAPGDRVEAGHLMFELAAPDLEARIRGLSQRWTILQAEVERWRRLEEAEAAGSSEVNAARLRALEVAEALAEAEALRDAGQLRAPAAGGVVEVAVGVGSQVGEGQVLATVEDERGGRLRLRLPARERPLLDRADGRRIVRTGDGTAMEALRLVYSEAPEPGFLLADVFVAAASGRQEATLTWIAEREALTVPWTAVARDAAEYWVAVVHPGTDAIERRTVRMGRGAGGGGGDFGGAGGRRADRALRTARPAGRPDH